MVPTGRYVQGGTTQYAGGMVGWWDRRVFSKSTSDTSITLPAKFDRRPDLLAYEVYNNSQIAWVILQYNNIMDVNTEFVSGAQIILPSLARVQTEFLTKNI